MAKKRRAKSEERRAKGEERRAKGEERRAKGDVLGVAMEDSRPVPGSDPPEHTVKVATPAVAIDCCAACRFWATRAGEGECGNCRRYPPGALTAMSTTPANSPLPVVLTTDWCGEFSKLKLKTGN